MLSLFSLMANRSETNLTILKAEDRLQYNCHLHIPVAANRDERVVTGIRRFNKDVERVELLLSQYQAFHRYLVDEFQESPKFKELCTAFGNISSATVPI